MKMLFYSSDGPEVELVSKEFQNAGIACEVRKGPVVKGEGLPKAHRPQSELWIQNDKDCHRAFMLCVQLGIGFAKRARRRPVFHVEEDEPQEGNEPGSEIEAVREDGCWTGENLAGG